MDDLDCPSVFVSIPVSENFTSTGIFRPERRAFYEQSFEAISRHGIMLESAAINEKWGAVKLKTQEFTEYDLQAISRCDGLMVLTNTRMGSDIFLEIGYAAAQGKPVLVIAPWGTRLTYMLQGMEALGHLEAVYFDTEGDVVSLLAAKLPVWKSTMLKSRS